MTPQTRGAKGLRTKCQKEQSDQVLSTYEPKRRAVRVPDTAEPAPVQTDLAIVPAAKARSAEVTIARPNDRFPAKHVLSFEVFSKKGDAFLLNFFQISQTKTVF